MCALGFRWPLVEDEPALLPRGDAHLAELLKPPFHLHEREVSAGISELEVSDGRGERRAAR